VFLPQVADRVEDRDRFDLSRVIQESMSLTYEPASETLHISVADGVEDHDRFDL